jgi:hypothetical protein
LYAGLFFDWDIDEAHYATNRTAYDAARLMGYAWDESPGLPYVGVLALGGVAAGFSAIPNNGVGSPVNLLNGFSKAEKWDVLQGGTGVLAAGPTDVSNALSTGPHRLPPGGRALAAFALVAGNDLALLQANADQARAYWVDSVLVDVPGSGGPRVPVVAIGPAVPNPFNPRTRFTLDVASRREVRVGVYDAGGRFVRGLAAGSYGPGRWTLEWDGRDARGLRVSSGVYFVRLESAGLEQVRRIVLAR